ncbi:MAG: dihydrodipicolinate synthase family protein [Pseudomonadota bacterium]
MLAGLSAFALTPMDNAGVVDVDHLARLVARLAATDVASVGVLGSTGSYMYLSAAERARAIAAAVQAAGQTPVLAGIGALRTSDVVAHAKAAEAAGASALLLAPVCYLPLTDRDVLELVETVSSATSLPLYLYNNPTTTGFTIGCSVVAAASAKSQVQGLKNPAPQTVAATKAELARLRECVPEGFVIGYSGDALIDGPLASGADAWYSVVAGVLPDVALELWRARGDVGRVTALHKRADPLWKLFNTHGSIRVVPHIAELLGLGSLPLPLPLQPLAPKVVGEIDAALDALKAPA